ncbi:YfhO family protein [Staphylococcus canis]|uniref:YfhO family protein n=1 Tax=Staphylococcus canis TaxID=2724942 RepID=A0ABS0T801_9STAP|nr:YfhO family protein [Staphylococcus canis]MBI5974882.1 YfhO family protein [Staphylococcus canis]
MKRFNQSMIIMITSCILALVGHAYIIFRFIKDGLLFTGPNDGIEQMVPIQMYLYQKWSEGTFFYASDFGLGGDFFTDLSYYFSTNILFILNALIIGVFAKLKLVNTHDLMFWMTNALVISVIKSALVIMATYLYAKSIKLNKNVAMLFAFLFASSPLYYRFTVYWPFFSDIFILLPLLFFSIERYFKTGKIGFFIVITAISFINNFYFAYYQVLAGLIYFAIRMIWKHHDDILKKSYVLWTLSIGAVLGVGCSLFVFFHSASSFIHNQRIPYSTKIPIFESLDHNTNIFYDNYLIVILYIVIQALLSFKLYRHFFFRLFAILSILAIVSAFIPYVDSVFNGFSAPQKRWHYLLAFATSGLIACYVQHFFSLSKLYYILTAIPGILVVTVSAVWYQNFVIWLLWIPIVFLTGLLILHIKASALSYSRTTLQSVFGISISVLMVLVSIVFTKNQIFHEDHENRGNRDYINKSLYNTPLQNTLVQQMKHSKDQTERIDWRVNEQDNTPMYQNFKGLSLYSSIFNDELIKLYYDHLMINLKEESVSRYQSTGGRANIASLLSVRYQMLKNYQDNLPEHFKLIQKSGQYRIYENEQVLPAVRVTNQYYNSKDLKTPIDREHAMIDGVILDHKGKPYQDIAPNLIKDIDISTVNAKWTHSDVLQTTQSKRSGVILKLPEALQNTYKDFYVTLYAKRGAPDSNSTISINGYQNHRLFNTSKYKTGQNFLLYRTKPDQNGNININVSPHGPYHFKVLGVYGEDYQTLEKADKQKHFKYDEKHSNIDITLQHHSGGMAVINIPYRSGFKATVDGKSVTPQKVNYFMTGIPVSNNAKNIHITYRPPYFYTMIFVSLCCVVLSVLYRQWLVKRIRTMKE